VTFARMTTTRRLAGSTITVGEVRRLIEDAPDSTTLTVVEHQSTSPLEGRSVSLSLDIITEDPR
jgi:hypothetical protein